MEQCSGLRNRQVSEVADAATVFGVVLAVTGRQAGYLSGDDPKDKQNRKTDPRDVSPQRHTTKYIV